jgi:hypothetical protein
MAKDFTKFLKAKIETFEAPPLPPIGHYFATIRDWKIGEKNYGERKGVVVTLNFTLTSQDEDSREEQELDEAELRKALAAKDYGLDGDFPQGHVLRAIAEKTLQLPVEGLDLNEVLDAMKGHEVKLYADHRADKNDSEKFYFDIKKVLPANE